MSLELLIPQIAVASKPFRQGPMQPSAALQVGGSWAAPPLGAQTISMTVASTTYLSVTGGPGIIQFLAINLPASTAESWTITLDGTTWDSRSFTSGSGTQNIVIIGGRSMVSTSGAISSDVSFPVVRFLSSFSVATGSTWTGAGTLYYLYTLDF